MAIEKRDSVSPGKGFLILKDGEFDIDLLYKVIVDWFGKRQYTFSEVENTEKVKPQGNDVNLKLYGDRKIDDYAEYHIEVFIIIIELRKKGSKYTGRMKIKIEVYIDLDYMGNWQKTPFTKFLFHVYNNFIIKKRIKDGYEDDLEEDAKELMGRIKKTIGLHD